jgi:hypothetical protein
MPLALSARTSTPTFSSVLVGAHEHQLGGAVTKAAERWWARS